MGSVMTIIGLRVGSYLGLGTRGGDCRCPKKEAALLRLPELVMCTHKLLATRPVQRETVAGQFQLTCHCHLDPPEERRCDD